MIALIRISGLVKMKESYEETLSRLRLRRKYTCVIIPENPEMLGMVKNIQNFVAYGKIDEKTFAEILKARGKKIGNSKAKLTETEAVKIAKEVFAGKKLEELGVIPYFGLHPARGGIDSKHNYPKGVLGNHQDNLSKLIMKML